MAYIKVTLNTANVNMNKIARVQLTTELDLADSVLLTPVIQAHAIEKKKKGTVITMCINKTMSISGTL